MNVRTIVLILFLFAFLLICGCTSQNEAKNTANQIPVQTEPAKITPEQTPDLTPPGGAGAAKLMEQSMTDALNNTQSGSHETIPLNDTRSIYLKENPTTGYVWNATVTSGLAIEEDSYVADPVKPGIAGSGGMHFWLIRGVEKGNQTFDAVYKRPWEPASVNDTRYFLNLTVE